MGQRFELSPSERLLKSILDGSTLDDDAMISDVVVEWTDIDGRRWRRAAGDECPLQVSGPAPKDGR